jgi:hypothetical protein
MSFTYKKKTAGISVNGDAAMGQPPVPDHSTQHQGGIRGKLDAMHSQAHESVKAQRNVTHKHGRNA